MRLAPLFTTSVGKKFLVAVSGLLMGGFVLAHMAGNMLIFVGPEAYNRYGHAITSNPLLLYGAEAVLLLALFVHLFYAISLNVANRRARGYAPTTPQAGTGKRGNFASRSMIYSGLLVLVFIVLHLWTFKYGPHYTAVYGGVEMRDLHKLVLEKFSEPLYVGWYLFSLLVLGVHLSHGFAAMVQSLGVDSVRDPRLKKASWAVAAIIAFGFISQPLYVFLAGSGKG